MAPVHDMTPGNATAKAYFALAVSCRPDVVPSQRGNVRALAPRCVR
jgi:hypothetical protein